VASGVPSGEEFTPAEASLLERYLTNLDGRVFALRNLPEVVKGALFSRYSRTEKSLRRVLLEEFLQEPSAGIPPPAESGTSDPVAADRAEDFYQRVLVGYGDDSVAELAGAHLAVERVSQLASKALEDARIGLSPLEKSTRYVRFDRAGADGRYPYYRAPELSHPLYEPELDALFATYADVIPPLLEAIRARHPIAPEETERAWKSATRAKAFDLLRGLLPAATFTNLGLYGNGRAFEYLLTKLSASELPECRNLAGEMHGELSQVIPAFIRRALDERYGAPAAARLAAAREGLSALAPPPRHEPSPVAVRLVEHDPAAEAERRVAAALVFAQTDWPLADLEASELDVGSVLEAGLGRRENRRDRAPRALEHASYTFEIVANFGAYRDLQRHRMLTQERQRLGTSLGFDVPEQLAEYGFADRVTAALERAGSAHRQLAEAVGAPLAQYAVPLAYRLRWYARLNLREVVHLCELRTTPQGHPDYRHVAQELFREVQRVHPRLAGYARFVDLGEGDEMERRASERRIDEKLRALQE
jgi:thymidylate synthase ThyX